MPENVLIVACLKDDGDGEMWRMTNAIEKHERNVQKNTVTVIKFSELSPKYAHTSIDGKKFNELIITGHSRFFPSDTPFHDQNITKLKGLSLSARRIGGYKIEEITPFIIFCILNLKVNKISIWCCESALNIDTYQRVADPPEVIINISAGALNSMKTLIYSGNEADQGKVSTVGAITFLVSERLKKEKYAQDIIIRGMNGVGYISDKKPDIVTFDQKHLDKLSKIKEDEFLEKYVDTKKSAHVFGFHFNPFTLAGALSTAYSIFPWAPSGLNYALANEPVLLNGMKVIFDQPVGLYPVNLESKEEARRNGA